MVYNNGRFDHAVWDPIAGRTRLSNRVDRMTIHTAVTSSEDIYGPNRGPGRTYAHFYNPLAKRIRQHQEIHHKAYADGYGNGKCVAVEHEDDGKEMPLSKSQIDDDARLFAYLVLHHGLKNRIATIDDTRGLAWHRLGVRGNFGNYNPNDRKTWSRAQTGENWSDDFGKVCPWNTRIDQIDDIYELAQEYIKKGGGSSVKPTPPKPRPRVVVDGKWGSDLTTNLQKEFKSKYKDGEVSRQNKYWKKDNPGLTIGWDWMEKGYGKGSPFIEDMQEFLKKHGWYSDDIDGLVGPNFIKGVQKWMTAEGLYDGKIDGEIWYPSTAVKALQKWVNKGGFKKGKYKL